ncbi:MAG: hypothetical protein NC124_13720 [Clostridium sp.]|nr:hypothetical protein [Clostridium sp.]
MAERPEYFEAALSDFMYDMASGGAIRHLVESGYSIEQIIRELDFPTPRQRVEQTVYKYMTESGMLLAKLPVEENGFTSCPLRSKDRGKLRKRLLECIAANGQEAAYMSCPFGQMMRNDAEGLEKQLSVLTLREREYIFGIRWEQDVMYHRLNSRMLEIGVQLAAEPAAEYNFYFLKSREKITIS